MPVRGQQSHGRKAHFSVLYCGGFFLWSVFFIFFFCPSICIALFSTVNIVCDRYQDNSVWGGHSWLGRRDVPAVGAVLCLGASCSEWRPPNIPGTHLPYIAMQ